MQHVYPIALGSNRRHVRHGRPTDVLAAATDALCELGDVQAVAPVMTSRPIGPSRRAYANGALLLESTADPRALLTGLKAMEMRFGLRRGRRWSERTLDLDIILWSGGMWNDRLLHIPHLHFRARGFVLKPCIAIAAKWRDPVTGLSLSQLRARLKKYA